MAPRGRPPKRKHEAPEIKRPKKRQKRTEELYEAKTILRESETEYEIAWAGTDPKTGLPYEPTWEPKTFANTPLVRDWERTKAARVYQRLSASPTAAAGPSNAKGARERSQRREREIPSSPPVQPTSAEPHTRSTTFTHSQPTPSQTPEHEAAADLDQHAVTGVVEEHQRTPAQTALVSIIPSQRDFGSDQYEVFNSQLVQTSSASVQLVTPEQRPRPGQRKDNFVVPDTQEPDSSSYLPETTTQSAADTTAQDPDSSSVVEGCASSPIEEVTQYQQNPETQPSEEDDPITDPTSPLHQGVPVEEQSSSSQAAIDDSVPSQVRDHPKSSVGSLLGYQNPDIQSPLSSDQQPVLLYTAPQRTPRLSNSAESGPSAALDTLEQASADQPNQSLNSNVTSQPSQSLSSSTLQRDWADTTHVSTTIEVVPSIERSPSPAEPSIQQAGQSVDQADISTVGEYSGPHQTTSQPTHPQSPISSQARRQPRSYLITNSPLLQQIHPPSQPLPRPTTPLDLNQTSLSQPSRSTRFATQLPRTPLRTMDAISATSTPDTGARMATRSLADKLAEAGSSVPRPARTLKEIAMGKAAQEGTRSPSVIPNQHPFPNPPNSDRSRMQVADFGPELKSATAAVAEPTIEASVEEEVVAPLTADRSSPLSEVPDEVDDIEELIIFPTFGVNEYALALPSPSSSTDAYRKHLTAHSSLIAAFLSRPTWSEDADIVIKAAKLVQQLKNYMTHPDLENEEALTQDATISATARALSDWDVRVSAKFDFLGHLITALEDTSLHIMITSADAIIIDKLKLFCLGRGVRMDTATYGESKSLLISLFRTSDVSVRETRPADLILTFDETFNASDPKYTAMRRGTLTPVLNLFVHFAIDHVERCIPPEITGVDRLQRLLHYAAENRRLVGNLDLYAPRPTEAAALLATYLQEQKTDPSIKWPFQNPDLIDVESPSQSQSSASTTTGSATAGDETDESMSGVKRSLTDAEELPAKRLRTTQQASIANDTTHISESLAVHSSQLPVPEAANHEQMLKLSNQAICLTAAIERLQARFEDQTKELRATRNERQAAETKAAVFQKQIETRDATITTLKDERAELRRQAKVQSEALKASSIPEIAELEQMRAALTAMEQERDKAQSRYKMSETTSDYVREQYQQSGSRMMELSAENELLKERVAELEKKASGEAVKLKQLVTVDREKAWLEEIERQRGRIESLEILVTRLQEQKKELQDQRRVQTRQGSMPPVARSPRVGTVSRTGSPAPMGLGIGGSRLREGATRT